MKKIDVYSLMCEDKKIMTRLSAYGKICEISLALPLVTMFCCKGQS